MRGCGGEGRRGWRIRNRAYSTSKWEQARDRPRLDATDLKIFLRHIPLPSFEEVDCSKSSSRECYGQEEARGG